MKRFLKFIGIILLIIVLIVVGYVGSVWVTYDRIEDYQQLEVVGGEQLSEAVAGEEYTIVTQNVGFGAYTRDFSFFMDGGTESRAASPSSVKTCLAKAVTAIDEQKPDIIVWQEVDEKATRSHKINEVKWIETYYNTSSNVYACNYDSAYLMYPIWKPHGKSKSGIITVSNFTTTSALRRSLKVSDSFSKLIDLDRCYSVCRIPVTNGKELVIYNVHMSAYGGSDEIRYSQLTQLCQDMKAEYDKGNYAIAGGDFNCDFTGTSVEGLNGKMDMSEEGWAQPMLVECIPEGISRCVDYTNGTIHPTCRNCDIPYEEGNFTIIVDGFLISDNVEMTYLENVQTGFEYSDHMPVTMRFKLIE